MLQKERLGFISHFVRASPEQQEKMRRYKVQGATLMKVFVSLFRDNIMDHFRTDRYHRDHVWVVFEMQPFNLLAQGHRLLMDSVRFVIDRQTSPRAGDDADKDRAALKAHIKMIPAESMLTFIKSEDFTPFLMELQEDKEMAVVLYWLYALCDPLSAEQRWQVMWQKGWLRIWLSHHKL